MGLWEEFAGGPPLFHRHYLVKGKEAVHRQFIDKNQNLTMLTIKSSFLKFILTGFALCPAVFILQAQQINITGPAGSGQFGFNITVLTNGNYVVTDPYYNEGGVASVGAVYLYNGSTHSLISVLKGSAAYDGVGGGGITALTNGNYVVRSPNWKNGAMANAGAVTWCNGSTGTTGAVNSSNSLVGSNAGDNVGNGGIIALSNGNYVVRSYSWKNGAIANAGAVTWCNGSTGTTGAVNSSNSLVGSSAGDAVGDGGIIALSNGNYVVLSSAWKNGTNANAGAATWGNGTMGITGVVSSSNSLVGSNTNDQVGYGGIVVLSNGNYVVRSLSWKNGANANAGAATWGNGTTGITGLVSSSNSLVGSNADDGVGIGGITALSNGNYVVRSSNWKNGANASAGAVTWGNGSTGITGVVSNSNSLVGSNTNDQVGYDGVTALSNGNYVVRSSNWRNGANGDAGAVTWCNGNTGLTGLVSSSNSLVGSTANDRVGIGGILALSNGNYVVNSYTWDKGSIIDAGAVTWGNGSTGISGVVSSSNSLVGSTANDQVGNGSIFALSNGNYVVNSSYWDNGAIIDAGAATWGNGATGITGVVSSSNSLVGSTANDMVGWGGVIALSNGNYVVRSYSWNASAGAATWGNGTTGITGVVSSGNSLVGSNAGDNVGGGGILALSNGNYVVRSFNWKNGANANAGAATWGNGSTGITGLVSSSNSLVGSTANDQVGSGGITALSNGNYVVNSYTWDNGPLINVGAVTWGNGSTGIAGVVSSSNSLVGGTAGDVIGSGSITALPNGNYVVRSFNWKNGALINAGAVTWGNGSTGITGLVSSSNSLVGSTANDQIGNGSIIPLSNGNYVFRSSLWDNGALADAGAFTHANGSTGITGVINSCNSVIGSVAGGGSSILSIDNGVYGYVIFGKRQENTITIYKGSDYSVANSMDEATITISGSSPVAITTSSGCRIIATVTPQGASPVSGSVTAKTWIESSVPTYGGLPFVARHYEITPATNPITATGNVTLYFTQQEFDDFNNHPGSALKLPGFPTDAAGKANLRVAKYSGASSNGTGLPGTYSSGAVLLKPADNDIVWNATLSRWEVSVDVTGFSGFIVQTSINILPLNLLSFSAQLNNNDARLTWKTGGEINTKEFMIERSFDKNTFSAIGMVAAENRAGIHQYNYTDVNIALQGIPLVYYRLKQVDINGNFTYSPIAAVNIKNNTTVNLYPNPASTQLQVTIVAEKGQQVNWQIADIAGRIVQQAVTKVARGNNLISINVNHLPAGLYQLQIQGEGFTKRESFVKK